MTLKLIQIIRTATPTRPEPAAYERKAFPLWFQRVGTPAWLQWARLPLPSALGAGARGTLQKKKPRGERALPRARGQGSHLESWSGATPSMHLVTKAWSQGRLFASFKI